MINKYYKKLLILFVCIVSAISHVNAHDAQSKMTVSEGYIKENIPGNQITAAYMTINNSSEKAMTLQKVTSNISDRIEIHEHSMEGDMMRMRQVDNITIDANSNVTLRPHGLHLMVFSLKQQLKEPDIVKLTLHFSNETKINIQLPVYQYK